MDPNGESGTLVLIYNHVMTRLSDNSDIIDSFSDIVDKNLASDCLHIFELAATTSTVMLALKEMHDGSSASKSLVSAHW